MYVRSHWLRLPAAVDVADLAEVWRGSSPMPGLATSELSVRPQNSHAVEQVDSLFDSQILNGGADNRWDITAKDNHGLKDFTDYTD
jgi:hypothetical protein